MNGECVSLRCMNLGGREWFVEGWWLRDHKPEPWPTTAEERRAAALRYGLRETDYTPLPRDEHMGNYPDLGNLNFELKDPYEDWSFDNMRRNFNEPVAYDYHLTTWDRCTTTGLEPITPWQALCRMSLIVFGFVGFIYFSKTLIPVTELPLKSKQYPYDYDLAWPYKDPLNFPLTQYTFEPAN